MDNVNLTIAICNIGCGLLVRGLSVPLIKGMVKMNKWYGIRLFKSFESEEHWYKINKKGGKILFAWSVVILLSGILCLFLPKLEGPSFWVLLLAPFALCRRRYPMLPLLRKALMLPKLQYKLQILH